MYLYPHFFAARAHRQKKDNGLILALSVLSLNLGQLNFRRLCLLKSKYFQVVVNISEYFCCICFQILRSSFQSECDSLFNRIGSRGKDKVEVRMII